MRRSWASITVGLLAIVVLGGAYAIFQYTSGRMKSGEGYVVFARFTDAGGLYDKSGVRSAGLDVGQIEGRSLDQSTGKAKVTIRLDPKKIIIYENAIVSRKAASLLGEIYLDIDPGTPVDSRDGRAQRQLKDGDEIKYVFESTSTSAIIDQVGATLPILRDILKDVQTLTSGPVKQIADNTNQLIAKNSVVLDRLLGRIDDIAGTIQKLTRDEAGDIKLAIQNAREITEGLKGLVGTAKGEVTGASGELRTSLQKLQHGIDSLDKSLSNVEKVTGKVADGDGTLGHLVNDDTIARNIEDVSEGASSLLGGVTRMQTVVGLRTEYNYLASTLKSYFEIRLMPRPDKFYLIEIVNDPRGFREASSTITRSSERGFVVEDTVKTSEKLRWSFQFGKRIGPWTGRFGIKESTGGLGTDIHFFDDRLSLSADLFDARSNVLPRLTGRGMLAVYKKNIFITSGVDDVLNYTRVPGLGGQFFDWFFGAQLQFNDEDLKSLLLVGGSAAAGSAGK